MDAGMNSPVIVGYQKIWQFVDLLYPPVCGGCGKPGTRWCEECAEKIKLIKEPVCPVCGLPLKHGDTCSDCENLTDRHFTLRSWAVYEDPLRNVIHRIKYNQDIGLAENFVKYMIRGINQLDWKFDIVIPVPLNGKRKKERGYNQSALLAWPIASANNSLYKPKALVRTKNTISQTKLDADARHENVKGVFEADSKIVKDQIVLLVDDLATTCSTIEACSEALIRAGAKSVYAYTLARTL
jgi:competence protein ComFC